MHTRMKTVKEAAKAAGVSIRTLHYRDEIGLVKPSRTTRAGYRLYDDEAMARLMALQFYRELGLPLGEIRRVLAGSLDPCTALEAHRRCLEARRNRIDRLLEMLDDRLRSGVALRDFAPMTMADASRILTHARTLQGEAVAEACWQQAAETLTDSAVSARLIRLYGGKDRAIHASLQADGSKEAHAAQQAQMDALYRAFAALGEDDSAGEQALMASLDGLYRAMFRLENPRMLLLEVAAHDAAGGSMAEATDRQYGAGVAARLARAIRRYEGE